MSTTNPRHRLRRARLPDAESLIRLLRTIRARQLFLAGSGWITLLGVTYLPPGSPPRVVLVFAFILLCPGFAVSGLLVARESAERWVLSVALSMSFALLVSVAFSVLRNDSLTLSLAVLALITTIAVLVDILVSPRRVVSSAPADERVQR